VATSASAWEEVMSVMVKVQVVIDLANGNGAKAVDEGYHTLDVSLSGFFLLL
jgi:hypothetical protein